MPNRPALLSSHPPTDGETLGRHSQQIVINPLIEAKHRDHRTLGQKLESLVNTPWKALGIHHPDMLRNAMNLRIRDQDVGQFLEGTEKLGGGRAGCR